MRAYLIGQPPRYPLGYTYVTEPDYEAVVIGSLTLAQLLHFSEQTALEALAEGKPVILYEPGLPTSPKNRALAAALAARRRELKNWGIVFTDGAQKKLITAQEARMIRQSGGTVRAGAVLTPLAREILEDTQ